MAPDCKPGARKNLFSLPFRDDYADKLAASFMRWSTHQIFCVPTQGGAGIYACGEAAEEIGFSR